MPVNPSKSKQARFWKEWKKSGAVATFPKTTSSRKAPKEKAHRRHGNAEDDLNEFLGLGYCRVHTYREGNLDPTNRHHRRLLM